MLDGVGSCLPRPSPWSRHILCVVLTFIIIIGIVDADGTCGDDFTSLGTLEWRYDVAATNATHLVVTTVQSNCSGSHRESDRAFISLDVPSQDDPPAAVGSGENLEAIVFRIETLELSSWNPTFTARSLALPTAVRTAVASRPRGAGSQNWRLTLRLEIVRCRLDEASIRIAEEVLLPSSAEYDRVEVSLVQNWIVGAAKAFKNAQVPQPACPVTLGYLVNSHVEIAGNTIMIQQEDDVDALGALCLGSAVLDGPRNGVLIHGNNISCSKGGIEVIRDQSRPQSVISGGAVYSISGNRIASNSGIYLKWQDLRINGSGSLLLLAVNWIRGRSVHLNGTCAPPVTGGTEFGIISGAPSAVVVSDDAQIIILGNDIIVSGYGIWLYRNEASIVQHRGLYLAAENRAWSWREVGTAWTLAYGYTGLDDTIDTEGVFAVVANDFAVSADIRARLDAILYQRCTVKVRANSFGTFAANRVTGVGGTCFSWRGTDGVSAEGDGSAYVIADNWLAGCATITTQPKAEGRMSILCNWQNTSTDSAVLTTDGEWQPVSGITGVRFVTNKTATECAATATQRTLPDSCVLEQEQAAGIVESATRNASALAMKCFADRCGWRSEVEFTRPWTLWDASSDDDDGDTGGRPTDRMSSAFRRHTLPPAHGGLNSTRRPCSDGFDYVRLFRNVVDNSASDASVCRRLLSKARRLAAEALSWQPFQWQLRRSNLSPSNTASRQRTASASGSVSDKRTATHAGSSTSRSNTASVVLRSPIGRTTSVTHREPQLSPTEAPATTIPSSDGGPTRTRSASASSTGPLANTGGRPERLRQVFVVPAVAAASVVSVAAAVVRPSVSARSGQVRAIVQLVACGEGLEGPVYYEHPFQFTGIINAISQPPPAASADGDGGDDAEEEERENARALVGATLMTLFVMVACGAVGAAVLVQLIMRSSAQPMLDDGDSAKNGCAHAFLAGHDTRINVMGVAASVTISYFAPSVLAAVTGVLYRAWYVAFAAALFVPIATLLTAILLLTTYHYAQHSMQAMVKGEDGTSGGDSPSDKRLFLALAGTFCSGAREDCVSVKYFFLASLHFGVDLAAAALYAVLSGVQPSPGDESTCRIVSAMGVAVAAVLVAYAFLIRPFPSGAENALYGASAVMQLACAILLAAAFTGIIAVDAAVGWVDWLSLALAAVVAIEALYLLGADYIARRSSTDKDASDQRNAGATSAGDDQTAVLLLPSANVNRSNIPHATPSAPSRASNVAVVKERAPPLSAAGRSPAVMNPLENRRAGGR